jgi:F-type H+-transporting ATPase subunit a
MLGVILALLQHAPEAAAEHAEKAAEEAEREPAIVEWVNHTFGPAVLSVERVIMPKVYGLFGATWHEPGADKIILGHVLFTLILMVIVFAGVLLLRGKLSVDRPSKGQQLLEVVVEQIRGLLDQVIGPYGRRYVPVIGAFAMFILIGNLMSLIPGLGAPTDNINVTGALGITSFLYYIATGFRQQGWRYLKHFTGGLEGVMLFALGPLIFVVEILSNSVRPVTLSLRLFVNMFADHRIGSVFLELAPWLVPIFTIVLGVFVSFVQTFIFIMLSMVYLSETVPHEEHDAGESGHVHEPAEAH